MITNDWILPRSGFYISPDKKVLIVKASSPDRIVNAFPPGTCRAVPFKGFHLVAMPYHDDTLMLLRSLGAVTKGAEILRHRWHLPKIEGVFDPMPHQVSTAAFLSESPRGYVTSTMRTGKTASAIIAARYLQRNKDAGAALIISTVTNMDGVWRKEIEGMYPNLSIVILHDKDPKKRKELLKRPADFYIINYDGIKLLKDELCQAVENNVINTCIVDELTHYQNTQSQLWQAADEVINGSRWKRFAGKTIVDVDGNERTTRGRRLRQASQKPIKYVWGLTGTPGGPDMIYGQVLLVTPSRMNMSFTAWRERTMVQIGFKWVPREGYRDIIFQVMQPCIRFDKKDIMKLPPVTSRQANSDLSVKQKLIYTEIKKDMVAASGEVEIKASTKAALVSKLLQIAGGVVIGEGGTVELDMKPRMDMLKDIIESAAQKVVVFCAFTAVIDRVETELTKMGYTVGVVDGRVSNKKRDEIFHSFQYEKDPHIILCHPRTTAFGVELAAADTMVFFGPPMSGEFVFQQAVERMSSLKQKGDSIQIVHLTSCAEERTMFRNILNGVSVNESINDMFTEIVK